MCSKGDNNGENIFLFLKSEEVKNDVRWGHQVIFRLWQDDLKMQPNMTID
jgi:hypothetical protein